MLFSSRVMIPRLLCVSLFHVICMPYLIFLFLCLWWQACSLFLSLGGWVKCPKCISPQTHRDRPRGAAHSLSIRLGFQMFPGNGLSTCIILFLLLLMAWGRIQSTQRCAVAHIQQITAGYKKPITYSWARTQTLLQETGVVKCGKIQHLFFFTCDSGGQWLEVCLKANSYILHLRRF